MKRNGIKGSETMGRVRMEPQAAGEESVKPPRKRQRSANNAIETQPNDRRFMAGENKTDDSVSFAIPNTLAESSIEFLMRKDRTVHVGALCSLMQTTPKDLFQSDSPWIPVDELQRVFQNDKKLRPIRDSFAEIVQYLHEMRSDDEDEDDKENLVPYRCVDFLKQKYGHNRFDPVHLMTFGGLVYNAYVKKHGKSPPSRADGFRMYFTRDIPVMQQAFDAWDGKLVV
eukprot:jgi/Mesvir1/7783/Mv11726-RA.1